MMDMFDESTFFDIVLQICNDEFETIFPLVILKYVPASVGWYIPNESGSTGSWLTAVVSS